MALKRWFKDKKESDRWINPHNNNSLEIDSSYPNGGKKLQFIVTGRDEHYYVQSEDYFKTKSQCYN